MKIVDKLAGYGNNFSARANETASSIEGGNPITVQKIEHTIARATSDLLPLLSAIDRRDPAVHLQQITENAHSLLSFIRDVITSKNDAAHRLVVLEVTGENSIKKQFLGDVQIIRRNSAANNEQDIGIRVAASTVSIGFLDKLSNGTSKKLAQTVLTGITTGMRSTQLHQQALKRGCHNTEFSTGNPVESPTPLLADTHATVVLAAFSAAAQSHESNDSLPKSTILAQTNKETTGSKLPTLGQLIHLHGLSEPQALKQTQAVDSVGLYGGTSTSNFDFWVKGFTNWPRGITVYTLEYRPQIILSETEMMSIAVLTGLTTSIENPTTASKLQKVIDPKNINHPADVVVAQALSN